MKAVCSLIRHVFGKLFLILFLFSVFWLTIPLWFGFAPVQTAKWGTLENAVEIFRQWRMEKLRLGKTTVIHPDGTQTVIITKNGKPVEIASDETVPHSTVLQIPVAESQYISVRMPDESVLTGQPETVFWSPRTNEYDITMNGTTVHCISADRITFFDGSDDKFPPEAP